MSHSTQRTRSVFARLVARGLAATVTLLLAHASLPAHAQQTPAKKSDSKKSDESKSDDQPQIPPPKAISDDEWLTIEPFDRLVLAAAEFGTGKTVEVDVECLYPRPFPLKAPRGEKLEEKVRIRLLETSEEFDVLRTRIVKVKHFEDLLLEQGEKWLRPGEDTVEKSQTSLNRAFDLFTRVANLEPHWPGLGEKLVAFWYREANLFMMQGGPGDSRALNILHVMRQECVARNIKEHENTKREMGRAAGRIVDRAFREKNYPRARHYLFIFESGFPGEPLGYEEVQDWRKELLQRAQARVKEAKQKEAAGQLREASLAILEAADMWPSLPGIEEEFNRIFAKYPILPVAVRELPDRFAPWAPPGSGDARVAQLLYVPLTEVSGVGENTKFTSRILDQEIGEGGRQLTLRVKSGLRWSDAKPITAMDVSRAISARCDPGPASYDAALKSVLKGVTVSAVNEVVVDLNRTPLRGRELSHLLFNLAPGHRGQGKALDVSSLVSVGPFKAFSKRPGVEAVVQANEHFFGGRPKTREIVERRYATGRDAVNALLAADVSLVEHVPAKQLRRIESRIESRNDLRIARSGVPALHVISFDFRTREFAQSRTLRRALGYALDRKTILENALLDSPGLAPLQAQRQQIEQSIAKLEARKGEMPEADFNIEMNRLKSPLVATDQAIRLLEENELAHGPFPKGSYAFDPSLEPWYYDPVLAKGLLDASMKELQTQSFSFRLHYPDVEEAREACTFIKAYWESLDPKPEKKYIQIVLVPRPLQELEEDIALGRRFDMVYRIHYVRDTVLDAARVLCLGPPISRKGEAMANCGSPWLRQNLRELELATNWPQANDKLQLIQQQARNDVAIIPLWQLTDYYAYHERLHGVVDKSLGFYQDAAGWQIDPWFRKDPQ